MFKNFKTIRQLKKLRQAPVNKDFLNLLRFEIEYYVDLNPMEIKNRKQPEKYLFIKRSNFPLVSNLINNFRNLKIMPVPIIIALIAALVGGGGVTMASQNSLPGDVLFPVKVLTEEARAAFAFDAKSEANLQMKFAARRVGELKDLLEQRGVDAGGIDIALARLEDNTARAAARIEVERRSGREMSATAKQIDDSLFSNRKRVGELFSQQEKALESRIDGLIGQIQAARSAGDEAKASSLSDQLKKVQALKEKLYEKKEKAEKKLRDKERMIEQSFSQEQRANGDRANAQEAILQMEQGRRDLIERAGRDNVVLSESEIKNLDDNISQAKSDLQAGRFREAENRVEDSWHRSLELERGIINSILGEQRRESEVRGGEAESRGQEQEARGREQEQERTQTQTQTRDRGQEQESRGQEQELRGRQQEGEAATPTPTQNETRGQETERRGGNDLSPSNSSGGGNSNKVEKD